MSQADLAGEHLPKNQTKEATKQNETFPIDQFYWRRHYGACDPPTKRLPRSHNEAPRAPQKSRHNRFQNDKNLWPFDFPDSNLALVFLGRAAFCASAPYDVKTKLCFHFAFHRIAHLEQFRSRAARDRKKLISFHARRL